MKRLAALAALLLTVAACGVAGTSVLPQTNPDTNQVSYWCEAGIKYEPVDTPFVVPPPPSGYTWTLLVLKAGSGEGENQTFANPVVGQSYSRSDGKEISHAILCKAKPPPPATTTTSTTSTTSTSTTTTSTTLPPGVITPTVLYTPPTCESVGSLTFPTSPNYTVTNNGDGTYTFVANEGSVFPEGFEATVGPFPIAQLIGEQCSTTTTAPGSTTTTTTVPGQTTTTTTLPPESPVPFRFGAATTVCVAEVPTIRITFQNTYPELAGQTGTLTMHSVANGALLSTQSLVYRPGTTVDLLYPGTRVNANGSIADVPGWNLNSLGLWVRDPADAYLREGIRLTYTVNPTATATVSYPPESANCANPENPPPGLTPPPSGLPETE